MSKTIIILATAMATAMAGSAIAGETKQVSDSVYSIDGLSKGSHKSVSIVAYGEPPKEKKEVKRRFKVGFLPKMPPRPGEEQAMTDDNPTDVMDAYPEPATNASMVDTADDDATVSVDSVETQINLDEMELRIE